MSYGTDPRRNPWPNIPMPDGSEGGNMRTLLGMREVLEILINRRPSDNFRAVLLREFAGTQDPNEPVQSITNTTNNITLSRGYDIYAYLPGTFTSLEVVIDVPIVRRAVFPANLVGSLVYSGVAATGGVSFTLAKNGVAFGTLTFGAGLSVAAPLSTRTIFEEGDSFTLLAPLAPDPTLENLSLGLRVDRA